MKRLLCVALVAAISGCATTSGLEPVTRVSGFDGSRNVSIEPHGADCASITGDCIGLGAQWSSSMPGTVLVLPRVYMRYVGITGASLSIDGQAVELRGPVVITQLTGNPNAVLRESTGTFTTSLDTIRKLAKAERAWLRVTTLDGRIESALIEPGKDTKAIHAIRRFLDAVDRK